MDRATKRRLKHETKLRKKDERAKRKANRKPSVLLKELWNLPNMLTMGRILVIPLFVWMTYDADPFYSVLAAAIFAVAAITDVVDGFLARRWNMITVTGKLLDPLADKLIVMAAMVMMIRLGRIQAWVVIVLLGRELIIMGLRQIAASEGLVIAAGQEGKWKTSLQLVGIIALCVHYTHHVDFIAFSFDCDFNAVGKVLIYISTFFSAWSAIGYFRAFFNTLSKRGAPA